MKQPVNTTNPLLSTFSQGTNINSDNTDIKDFWNTPESSTAGNELNVTNVDKAMNMEHLALGIELGHKEVDRVRLPLLQRNKYQYKIPNNKDNSNISEKNISFDNLIVGVRWQDPDGTIHVGLRMLRETCISEIPLVLPNPIPSESVDPMNVMLRLHLSRAELVIFSSFLLAGTIPPLYRGINFIAEYPLFSQAIAASIVSTFIYSAWSYRRNIKTAAKLRIVEGIASRLQAQDINVLRLAREEFIQKYSVSMFSLYCKMLLQVKVGQQANNSAGIIKTNNIYYDNKGAELKDVLNEELNKWEEFIKVTVKKEYISHIKSQLIAYELVDAKSSNPVHINEAFIMLTKYRDVCKK
jgi:hypothetical protein